MSAHPRQAWLRRAVQKRLREELVALDVSVNEAKSKVVDLGTGGSFGFLGFEFRRVRSRSGRWMPLLIPKMTKRTELLRKLKAIFRRYRSQPIRWIINIINQILRGWVNYFAIGHASRCFNYIRRWIEQKIRRHLSRARQRRGFGWKRWSRQWIHGELDVFADYRVRYRLKAVAPTE